MNSGEIELFSVKINVDEFLKSKSENIKVLIMRVLEDLTDRACKTGLPIVSDVKMGLSDFVDWIRGLYPEYYVEIEKVNHVVGSMHDLTPEDK